MHFTFEELPLITTGAIRTAPVTGHVELDANGYPILFYLKSDLNSNYSSFGPSDPMFALLAAALEALYGGELADMALAERHNRRYDEKRSWL